METEEVLAALFSKTVQLEKRIKQLEEENAILKDIGMFALDKEEDIYQNILDVQGWDWKKCNDFTVDSEECTLPYLLHYISNYIWNKKTEDEPERYHW